MNTIIASILVAQRVYLLEDQKIDKKIQVVHVLLVHVVYLLDELEEDQHTGTHCLCTCASRGLPSRYSLSPYLGFKRFTFKMS